MSRTSERGALVSKYTLRLAFRQGRKRSPLFQRVIDRRERAVEGGAEAVHRYDDGDGNASGDQTVFDRGRAGVVSKEIEKKTLQSRLLREFAGLTQRR